MSFCTVKISTAEVQDQLNLLQSRLVDMTPVMRLIGEIVVEQVDRAFETGTSPSGVKWKPSKRVLKSGGQTLVNSSVLRNSFSTKASSTQVTVGTNVPYAAIHQFGGTIRRKSRTQVNAHKKSGRFMTRAQAARGKSNAIRISFATIGEGSTTMPARPYLPDAQSVDWTEIRAALATYLMRGRA